MKTLDQLQAEHAAAKRPLHKLALLAQIDQATRVQKKIDRAERMKSVQPVKTAE